VGTGYGQSMRGPYCDMQAGRRDAPRPGLEPLEPRVMLSGSGWEDVFAVVAADAAGDATDRFAWSGYDRAAGRAEFHYTFTGRPELTEGDAGVAVTLEGESDWIEAGDAMVPVRTSRVLLPPGTRIVSAEVTCTGAKVVATGVDLAAAPTPVPYGLDAPSDVEPSLQVPAKSFPVGEAVQWSTERLVGYSLGRLEVFPVRYDAAEGTVTFFRELSVSVTLGQADVGRVGVRDSGADLSRVLEMVDNDSAAGAYAPAGGQENEDPPLPLPSGETYEYVLVTSEALSDAFAPLVADKIARGIGATLVTTEYIDANYTSLFAGENDEAGRIREFLTEAYDQWNTRWVLLGGDVDQVPCRMVKVSANGETGTFPSDMYFACLDGPYDGNGDGDWAGTTDGTIGGDVDRAPELFVGRATVSTPADAANFVSKTIRAAHERHPNPSTCLWLGEKLDDDPTWGGNVMDAVLAENFPPQADHVKLYERDGSYSAADVVAALNASPCVVNHLGHSAWTNNAKLVASDVYALTNEAPYFMYSQGCEAGQFQRSDAIAEVHIQAPAGAWAVIMNTHYGWYLPGGIGGSYHWHTEFWDAVFHEGIDRVGEAHFDSKNDLGSSYGTDRWVFFACELFGDPEVRLRVVDPAGPRVLAHTPGGNADAPVSAVTLSFTERMDRAGFDPAADIVSFTGPGGTDLSGAITGYTWTDAWTLQVHFLPQSGFGTYELTVGPGIPDADGKAMDQDGDGQGGEPGEDAFTALFTLRAGGREMLLYSAEMTADPGWTLDPASGADGWAWGAPAGRDGDPGKGYTGANVIGYSLSGAYPNGMLETEYAATPAFDCSGVTFVTLSFRRWLGVEASTWDHAVIEASADGGEWVPVWANADVLIEDGSWTRQEVDLSTVAAGHASVRLRWGMGPTDGSVTLGGWNIDDVQVSGISGRTVIYSEDMSAEPGWTLDAGTEVGGWAWGVPAGLDGDPTSGYTGPKVIGFNLNGMYPNDMGQTVYATTPAFDCSGSLVVTLNFRRWLGVENGDWDRASIEVSADDGPWLPVWSNGGATIMDTSWRLVALDISAEAAFAQSVRIRWGMGPTDESVTFSGWNIDDVFVIDGITEDVLYSAMMDVDPGWTLEGGGGSYYWQWGIPAGAGGDPSRGATGDHVMGYNLGGAYPNDMGSPEYATTPPFDCTGFAGVTVTFQRWLGVENDEWDHATVEASADGGPWVQVWGNGTGTIEDTGWMSQSVDLSAVADGRPGVRLRWGMGPTDSSVTYGGWNIDDVIVSGQQTGPSVFTHLPAGDVEAGLDHLDVTFAAPIDESTFDAARVTLTGPSGAPVPLTGLGPVSGSTYRVQFAPLADEGTYTLRVGPGVMDEDGHSMDQDGDGALGEPGEDVYVGSFSIVAADTTGPAVDFHTPAGQVVGPQGRLLLHFDEPMDPGSFGLDDVSAFAGPGGDLLAAVYGYEWTDPQTLEVRFDAQAALGDYILIVGPNVRDDYPGHNPMDQNGDGTPGRVPGDLYYARFSIRATNPSAPTINILSPTVGDVCLADAASMLVLDAEVTDDGVGGLGGLTFGWTVRSQPGGSTVAFEDADAPRTVVSFSDEGTYELAMEASDGDLSSAETITVTVGDDGSAANVAPTIDAGTYTIAGGTTGVLGGTVVDDGNPPPSSLTFWWEQLSGPGETLFEYPAWRFTGIEVSAMGVYVYRLTADDGQVRTAADVTMAMALSGDANFDGSVGVADLSAVADNYGEYGTGWAGGDFNNDGVVGIADLSAVADHYADTTAGGGGGAPEAQSLSAPAGEQPGQACPVKGGQASYLSGVLRSARGPSRVPGPGWHTQAEPQRDKLEGAEREGILLGGTPSLPGPSRFSHPQAKRRLEGATQVAQSTYRWLVRGGLPSDLATDPLIDILAETSPVVRA